MSRAYISAVSAMLPKARIVFDHFHIVKLCNEMLTKLRRALYREATDQLQKDVLKGGSSGFCVLVMVTHPTS